MEDIGLAKLVFAGCFIKWPVQTATMILSLPISVGITLNDKFREKILERNHHKLAIKKAEHSKNNSI